MANPHSEKSTTLSSLAKSLWKNRILILELIKREIFGRYKGSLLGLVWSFFNPILMLIVYTYVFSTIFKSRWDGNESRVLFSELVFTGMIVLGFFSEVLNRSPSIILSNVNYVKKIVFPIEILPVVTVGGAIFHSIISFGVLVAMVVLFDGHLYWTVVFIPLVLLPLVIVTLGISWVISSIGVFVRDIGQAIVVLTTLLIFLSPVFYPVTAVPEKFRPFIMANPLTFIIEQVREILIFGHSPNFRLLSIYFVFSFVIAWGGYALFQKVRKGFADVL